MTQRIVITLPDNPGELGKADEAAILYKLVAGVHGKAAGSYLSALFTNRLAEWFSDQVKPDGWPDVMGYLLAEKVRADAAEAQLHEEKRLVAGTKRQWESTQERLDRALAALKEEKENVYAANREWRAAEVVVADLERELAQEKANHERDKEWYEAELRRFKARLYDLEHPADGQP